MQNVKNEKDDINISIEDMEKADDIQVSLLIYTLLKIMEIL